MNKLFTIFAFLLTTNFSAQNIGLVESYNPNFMHAHLKGIPIAKLQVVEDLNYNIKPFIDSVFSTNNLKTTAIDKFDLSIFDNFDPMYGNKKIENNLSEFCKTNNLDGLIILKPYGNHRGKNLFTAVLENKMDFGIISYESTKKTLMYYNNIIILYYTLKDNKLRYPVRKRSEYLFFPANPVRFDESVFNLDDKTLTNTDKIKDKFLTDFRNRLKLNLLQTFEMVRK